MESPRITEREGRHRLGVPVALLFSLIGVALSAALLSMHAGKDAGWLGGICGEEGGGCETVLSSRWAVFPPGSSEVEQDGGAFPATEMTASHVPTAALGLFYFTIVAIWLALVVWPATTRKHRVVGGVLLIPLCGLSCLISLIYLGLMVTMKSFCPLCIASHVANFFLFGVLFSIRGRLTESAKPDTPAFPSAHVVGTVCALVIAVLSAEWFMYRSASLRMQVGELRKLAEKASTLELAYFGTAVQKIDIRPDDPVLEAAPGLRMELVYWSDVECPHCAQFDALLFDQILPMFGGHLRVVYKHNPLRAHKHARPAAKALEAAREQGRFWAMQRALIERRTELASVDYVALAKELGMDPDQFARDLESLDLGMRVAQDATQLNRDLKTRSVPAAFLNGRKLDNMMRSLPGFWEGRASALRRVRESRGQPWGNNEVLAHIESLRSGTAATVSKGPAEEGSTSVEVLPPTVSFGYVANAKVAESRKVRILNRSPKLLKISDVQSSNPTFQGSVRPVEDGIFELEVTTVPPLKPGKNEAVLTLRTGDGFEDIRVPAIAFPPLPFTVRPVHILLPEGPLPEETKRIITIRRAAGSLDDFKLSQPRIDVEGPEIDLQRINPDVFRLNVTFPGGFELSSERKGALVLLKTNLAHLPFIRVPVQLADPSFVEESLAEEKKALEDSHESGG